MVEVTGSAVANKETLRTITLETVLGAKQRGAHAVILLFIFHVRTRAFARGYGPHASA